jgi:hypothetical protein
MKIQRELPKLFDPLVFESSSLTGDVYRLRVSSVFCEDRTIDPKVYLLAHMGSISLCSAAKGIPSGPGMHTREQL